MTVADLQSFLVCEQDMRDVSEQQCQEIILTHEPSVEGRTKYQLSVDGRALLVQRLLTSCHHFEILTKCSRFSLSLSLSLSRLSLLLLLLLQDSHSFF